MSSYQVGDHVVDHPPLFACRKHKSFLKLNRAFVDELLAWAPDLLPQNLTDVAAGSLGGDDQAFKLSEYLIPPKVVIFNPRRIQGHGALPYVVVFIDRKFIGIPASYLRRRIFDGCDECVAENDPASDASFPDYKPPVKAPPKPAAPSAPAPAKATSSGTMPTVPRPTASGTMPAQPKPAAPPAKAPAPQQAKPSAVPTKSIPKRPGEPKFDAPPPQQGG